MCPRSWESLPCAPAAGCSGGSCVPAPHRCHCSPCRRGLHSAFSGVVTLGPASGAAAVATCDGRKRLTRSLPKADLLSLAGFIDVLVVIAGLLRGLGCCGRARCRRRVWSLASCSRVARAAVGGSGRCWRGSGAVPGYLDVDLSAFCRGSAGALQISFSSWGQEGYRRCRSASFHSRWRRYPPLPV